MFKLSHIKKESIWEILLLSSIAILIILTLTYQLSYTLVYGLISLNIILFLIGITFNKPYIFVLIYFLSSVLYLENPKGITYYEIIYFGIAVVSILLFFLPDLFRGNLTLNTPIDKLALLFIFLLPYGVILGLLNSGNTYRAIGEVTYYLGFMGFFAFRKYFNYKNFRKFLLLSFFLILVYVLIRNAIQYRQIILQAYAPWQIQNARATANEVIILLGSSIFLCFSLYLNNLFYRALATIFFIICVGGLIITQSRGYWIAFLFMVGVIFLLTNYQNKKYILYLFGLILVCSSLFTYIFFEDIFTLIITGLTERITSLSQALSFEHGISSIDTSIHERILEYKKIFNDILYNPIAGYGFGVSYDRYYMIPNIYRNMSYIHNGYLAVWYKLGLPGLIAILTYCFYVLTYSYKLFKQSKNLHIKVLSFAIFSTLLSMLLVNNTSPQFLSFDGMLTLALMGLFTSYYYDKLNNK